MKLFVYSDYTGVVVDNLKEEHQYKLYLITETSYYLNLCTVQHHHHTRYSTNHSWKDCNYCWSCNSFYCRNFFVVSLKMDLKIPPYKRGDIRISLTSNLYCLDRDWIKFRRKIKSLSDFLK